MQLVLDVKTSSVYIMPADGAQYDVPLNPTRPPVFSPIGTIPLSAFLVLNTLRKMYKTEFCLNNHTNGRNTNLSSKAGYGKNVYTGQQYVITYAGIDDRAYLNMQFVSEAPWKENNSTRAGYGFHNSGSNGGALYLDTDGRLKFVTSDTHTVYALDWHSL